MTRPFQGRSGDQGSFFAEGATLAHIVRPLALARELDPDQFDVTFCRPAEFSWLTADLRLRLVDLEVQGSSIFARRLENLSPLYDFERLMRYVEDDLSLIDAFDPDIVVGDFRLSLSVSSRLRRVPYITITDAYWAPENHVRAPLPVLPFPVLMQLGEEFGLHVISSYRRSYLDTLRPFANYRFLDEVCKALGNDLDRALDPKEGSIVVRRPHLIFYGLFGYFFPSAYEPAVIFRNPAAPNA